jgi:excisionase family DNA binding protein
MSDTEQKAAATRVAEPVGTKQSLEVPCLATGVRIQPLEAAVYHAYQESCEALPKELTTTQAAAFLDVSRPFVIKLIKRRELPCRFVGTHRRIPSAALLEYRTKMFQNARKAADEMAQSSQDLGLYDSESTPPKAQ